MATTAKNTTGEAARWAAWGGFLLVLIGAVSFVTLHFIVPDLVRDPLEGDVLWVIALSVMALAGVLVIARGTPNATGWLLLAFPLAAVLGAATELYAQYAIRIRDGELPGGALAAIASGFFWSSFLGINVAIMLVFPTGRVLSPLWRWALWGAALAAVLVGLGWMIAPEFPIAPPLENPIGLDGAVSDGIWGLGVSLAAVLFMAGLVTLVQRFKRSEGDERQQIKWFAYAASIFALLSAGTIMAEVAGAELSSSAETVIFGIGLVLLAGAIAVSILKYRLYDVDFLINRTLIYAPLTAVVAGAYVAAIALTRVAFEALTGERSDSELVVATLAAGAVFWVVRVQMFGVADRYFKDPREPARDLSTLRNDVQHLTRLIEPSAVSQERLAAYVLEGCVSAFDAEGGSIELAGRPAAQIVVGEAPQGIALSLDVAHDGTVLGKMQLRARKQGRGYNAKDTEALSETASMLGELLARRA